MARELSIDVELAGAVEADAAIARLALAFQKAGDSAQVAAEKADKFERAYKQGQARKQATRELDTLTQTTKATTLATDALTTAVMRYAGPAVLMAAANRTLQYADRLQSLSNNVKINTDTLQRWGFVAQKNNTTMEAVAESAQRLGANLVTGTKQINDVVAQLGLDTGKLLAMDPEARMRAVAVAIAKIENPALQAHAAQVLLGRSGRDLIKVLEDLAKGVDKNAPAMSTTWVKANADVKESLDKVLASATNVGMWMIGWAPVLMQKAGEIGDAWHAAFLKVAMGARDAAVAESVAVAQSRVGIAGPLFVGAPGAGRGPASVVQGSGLPAGATSGGGSGRSAGGARVLPFRQSTFALGSTAASIFAMANTPGGFNAGSLPFLSSFNLLSSGGSPISFGNGSGFAPTVAMNAPGAAGGGGFLSRLFGGGRLTNMAAGGLGLLQSFLPGMNRTGQGIGAMAGSFFGPLGSAIGGLGGGLLGSFFGRGKAEKNARSAETMQVFEQFSSKGFLDLQKQADKFGISMDKALAAKNMKDFGAAVDEVTAKLEELNGVQSQIDSLTEQSTVNFDKMNAVVREFGLDISKLGPAFQQAAVDKEAQRIIDAFAIMEKGGADINGVLAGMGDEISKVVQDSVKFGTTIPSNMKPWIEKLKESGQLVDENGEKITDISGLRFGDAMKSEMQKVVDKLDELITKLGELTGQFRTAKNAANDLAKVDYTAPEWTNPGGDAVGFHSGGVAGRDFRRPSHQDVFPALLRRGERVLPPGATGAGVSLSIGNLTVGGGYGSRADAVEDIGDAVVAYLERRGARLVA